MTQFCHNYFFKETVSPNSDTVILELRALAYGFWGPQFSP